MSWIVEPAESLQIEHDQERRSNAYALVTYLFGLMLLVVIGLALGGCATTGTDAKQTAYLAENDFTAALEVAVAYEALPTCSATQKFPCSDPATVTKITAGARVARASLATAETAARHGVTSPSLLAQAKADIAVFSAIAQGAAK